MRVRAETISLTRRLAQQWSARRTHKAHRENENGNALWIPRCQQYSIQGHLVRFECIAMLRNACKRPSRRRTRYETQTCEVDESKANFSAPYPNAKLSRNNRKEVDRPINEETIHYYCVQRRHGSKDRAKRRLRSVDANIVRSTCPRRWNLIVTYNGIGQHVNRPNARSSAFFESVTSTSTLPESFESHFGSSFPARPRHSSVNACSNAVCLKC